MAFDDEDEGSTPYEPGKKGGKAPDSVPPNARAEEILQQHQLVTDVTGQVFRYNGSFWAPLQDTVLAKLAFGADGRKQSSSRRRSEIVSAIKAITVDENLSWGRVGMGEIAFANGVLDLKTGQLRGHESEDYLERVLPWNYSQGAECPVWIQSLIDYFGDGDPGAEMIAALQEFFGYIATSHAKYKRCLVLLGESDSGKSQVLFAAMTLVGVRNVCQLGCEHMDDPTRRAVIVGKALNVMSEISYEATIRDEGFKSLVSTEDPVLIDEKFRPVYMYIPTAKHVIACNKLPMITDQSEAVFNRMLIAPFTRVFAAAEQDRERDAKHAAEMEGIAAWAAEGAKRLFARGGMWAAPEMSRAAMAAFRDEQNPASRFLEECFIRDAGAAEPLSPLLKQFNAWQGGKRTSPRALGDMLRKAAGKESIRKVRLKVKDGGQVVRCLVGWRFQGLTRNITFNVNPDHVAGGAEEITADSSSVGAGGEDPR